MKITLLLLSALFAISYSSRDRNNKPYKVVCYWGSWTYYRQGDGKFLAEDSNPNICTHMIYGFAKLNSDNTIGVYDTNLDIGDTNWQSGLPYGLGMYYRFNNLRNYNKHLTTLLSIGGWNEGSDKYSAMVSNPGSRATFINSVIKLLTEYDFDGLDLDWEYPGSKATGDATRTPGNPADKENYVALLRELHQAFQPHGFLVTIATSAGKPTIDRGYNIPEVTKYVDIINMMSYDFHGGWESKTAHNAPLYAHPNDDELDKEFTVEYAVNYWLSKGADPKKLVVGMGLYGRSFTLANGQDHGIGAPAVGSGGEAGPITRLVGMLGYNEICQFIRQGWKVYRDDVQKVPYAVNEGSRQWVGFDDEQSLKEKIKFLKSKGLGGAMVWSIDTDDFHGNCGKGKFPLLKTISRELIGVDGPDITIPVTHVTVKPTGNPVTDRPNTKGPHTDSPHTDSPHTDSPDGKFKCHGGGFFADPNDKTIFHECVNNGGGNYQDIVYHCGPGTIYDPVNHVCKMP